MNILIKMPAEDKGGTVRNRLKVYKEKTEPLIDYYKSKGLLLGIPGTGGPDKVFESMKQIINAKGL